MGDSSQKRDEKTIEGVLLFKLVCSMNQGNYADHSGTTKVQNAIDQLEAIKREGYSLVDIYHELEKLEK